MLSAMADGVSTIHGISNGEDVARTTVIMSQLGATIEQSLGDVIVTGPSGGLNASESELFCGNSGTTIRLLLGILSGIEGTHRITGDSSLSRRPMDRVATPLSLMGAEITGQGSTVTPPLVVKGRRKTKGIIYEMPKASAQVKSALLLAGLFANEPTTVIENIRTRSNTEEMLKFAGITLTSADQGSGRTITVQPGRPQPREWTIPGDPSQAAFFVVGGLIHPQGDVRIADLYAGPERLGYLSVLSRMGGVFSQTFNDVGMCLNVRHSLLRGTSVHSTEIPSVDEVPALVVAACAAEGESRFIGMSELRIKESDRFAESIKLAEALGAKVAVEGDDFTISGLGAAKNFAHIDFHAPDDHRMAMSSAIAAYCGQGGVIHGAESVETSFPNFFELLTSPS
jgi:3-phosphoshikimate 1-carboxyvinyltransferase